MAPLAVCAIAAFIASCWSTLDCKEADRAAAELIEEHASCDPERDSCEPVFIRGALGDNACIESLLCHVAVRAGTEAAFIRKARDITSRRECGQCALKCSPTPFKATCDPKTRRCRLSAVDASADHW